MKYLIDGYNLLFRIFHKDKKFEIQRETLINYFEELTSKLDLNISLIFDGYKQENEIRSISYHNKIKVIYTPKGQTADDYILEKISLSKKPFEIVVVTSDNILKKQAKQMHAQTNSVETFINWLSKKESAIVNKKKIEKDNIADTKKNIERLVKIFEKKMNEDSDDFL